jgi:hypothetical protein
MACLASVLKAEGKLTDLCGGLGADTEASDLAGCASSQSAGLATAPVCYLCEHRKSYSFLRGISESLLGHLSLPITSTPYFYRRTLEFDAGDPAPWSRHRNVTK